ncbi:MAG: prenyltransferase [Candidatus Bathyarchaeota archaeon]|nr:MAG: prenyltransferase [Candidatus Bathyarchaeota archaeon]
MNDVRLNFNTVVKLGQIIRIHIVLGGGLAYAIGILLAILETQRFSFIEAGVGYLVVFFGDLSTHYSNDYFDVEVDQQREMNKYFAGKRILVRNPTLRPFAKEISSALTLLSIGIAGITIAYYQVPVTFLVVTIIGNIVGWVYSAPPLRLSARGMGELLVALSTGWIIPSSGYLVVRGHFDPLFIFFTIPFILYGFMLSLSLEAPDSEIDHTSRRRNLVVRKGLGFTISSICAASALASALFLTYRWRISSPIIDLQTISLFSVIPLLAGCYGVYAFFWKNADLNRVSTINVMSLFAFNLLFSGYCIYLILVS